VPLHFVAFSCSCSSSSVCFFFFFQAEDGIRDFHVTGVQTCALPIYSDRRGCLRLRRLCVSLPKPNRTCGREHHDRYCDKAGLPFHGHSPVSLCESNRVLFLSHPRK